ncbi:MAG: hypothetical protein ACRC1W_17165 [Shewanella sp.]
MSSSKARETCTHPFSAIPKIVRAEVQLSLAICDNLPTLSPEKTPRKRSPRKPKDCSETKQLALLYDFPAVTLKPTPSMASPSKCPIGVGAFACVLDSNNISNKIISYSDPNSSQFTTINIINNRIEIDRGRLLARKPSSLNRDWLMNGGSTGNELLDIHSAPFLARIKAKPSTEAGKVEVLDCVMANLLAAYNTNSQLLYSRRKTGNDVRSLIQAVDYLEESNLVINVIGKANEFSGNSSWLIPTSLLRHQFEVARVRVALRKDATMVIVRDAAGNEKQLSRFKTRQPKQLREASEPVRAYNELWLNHETTLFGRHLVPFARRIFNIDLNHGGRFYGPSHQTISKAEREQILIDGEPTCEPDFKGVHFTLLYAQVGTQLNPLEDDPYCIEGFDRKTAKLASLVLLNSEDISSFKATVTRSGNPKVKADIAAYEADYELFIKRSSQGLPCTQPTKPKSAKGFIHGMPDGVNGGALYEAISKRHEAISHLFGTPNIGVRLQKMDSEIMALTLQRLADLNIPALPVHDSVRCRTSDCAAVMATMKAAYLAVTGFDGCVTL